MQVSCVLIFQKYKSHDPEDIDTGIGAYNGKPIDLWLIGLIDCCLDVVVVVVVDEVFPFCCS